MRGEGHAIPIVENIVVDVRVPRVGRVLGLEGQMVVVFRRRLKSGQPSNGLIAHDIIRPGFFAGIGHQRDLSTRSRWAIAFLMCHSTPFRLSPVRLAMSL